VSESILCKECQAPLKWFWEGETGLCASCGPLGPKQQELLASQNPVPPINIFNAPNQETIIALETWREKWEKALSQLPSDCVTEFSQMTGIALVNPFVAKL